MTQKIYDSVLRRLAVEVPLFAEPVLNKALSQLGTTPSEVTAFQMKKAIEQYVEPALYQKLGVHKTFRELGAGIIVLDKTFKIQNVSPVVSKLVPDIQNRKFAVVKDLTAEFITSGDKNIKLLTIPVIDENKDLRGAVCLVSDISFEMELENEMLSTYDKLLKSQKRLQDITMSSVDWVWEIDEDVKYTFASERVEQILGYKPSEIIGKTPFELMPKDEAERVKDIFYKLRSEKKPIVNLENWNLTKLGKRVCLLTNGVPIIGENGKVTGYRGVDKDITGLKKADEEMRKRNEELERFNEIAIDRELKMVELKKKIKELESKAKQR